MYLQEIIEVAVGLIFIWLVLSIATMQIQEWIATNILKWRSKDMETAIRKMLGDPIWAKQLYQNPVIAGLAKKTGVKPSYIPADKFAVALFDVVTTAGTDGSVIQRSLHTIREETSQMPNALWPLIQHVFNRWGKNIGEFSIKVWNFLANEQIITKNAKYEEILLLAQNASTSEGAMRAFLQRLVSDEPLFTTMQFIETYPKLKNLLYDMYKKINAVYKFSDSDAELNELPKGADEKILRALQKAINDVKEDEYVLKFLETFKFDNENNSTLDRIENGMDYLREINPTLHRSITTLTLGFQKVSESTTIADTVRNIVGNTENIAKQREARIASARTEIENWFNDSMERLSGWYKRKAQFMALIIGLILAILLNIDSITLARHLWKEPAVRQALAATADKFIEENPNIETIDNIPPEQAIAEFQERFNGLELPIGWEFYMWDAQTNSDNKYVCENLTVKSESYEFKTVVIQKPANDAFMKKCIVITNLPKEGEWFVKVFGVILTALAAMQGAPFWFDILKKLVNVRSSGANPAEKPKEETK